MAASANPTDFFFSAAIKMKNHSRFLFVFNKLNRNWLSIRKIIQCPPKQYNIDMG